MNKCKFLVDHRDTYRRTGRGSSGFTMHYREERCKRDAKDSGYCWQHERRPREGSRVAQD